MLLVSGPSIAVAEYLPAGTRGVVPVHPGADRCRFQVMGSVTGTPRCRLVTSEPCPLTQSAELQIGPEGMLMTSARCFGPTLNLQVAADVETTSTSN